MPTPALRLFQFAFFTHTMWFFGNLYEQIVDAPNLLHASATARLAWSGYHQLTNPIFYYVPLTQLGTVALWMLVGRFGRGLSDFQHRTFRQAAICSTVGVALTVVIVTQINLTLFFGTDFLEDEAVRRLAGLWLAGNAFRLVAVGACVGYLTKLVALKTA